MKIWRKAGIKNFIFLSLWLFFQAKAEEELVCDISGACENKVSGTKIEDPFDCHKYYICVTNAEGDVILSDAEILCPTGYYFNDEEQNCLIEDYKCRNKCHNLFCTKSCDNVVDGTLIAYPNDCSKFMVCYQESEPIVGECSSEAPYFNGTSCTTEANSCCDICTPYCEVAFTEVEDPYDCYSFYLCESDDYIPEREHFSCESGKYYDKSEGECVDSNGTICYPVCNWDTTTVLSTRETTWILSTQTESVSTDTPFTWIPSTQTESGSTDTPFTWIPSTQTESGSTDIPFTPPGTRVTTEATTTTTTTITTTNNPPPTISLFQKYSQGQQRLPLVV